MGNVKQQYIAERSHLERELILIRTALDSAGDAIKIADLTGRPIYHNQAFRNLFGYTADELTRAGGAPALFADPAVAGEVLDSILGGRPWSGEAMMRTQQGQRMLFALRADRITDHQRKPLGLIIACTDISERKRAEEQVRDQAKMLAVVQDAIIALDLAGTVTYWNAGAATLYEWPQEDAVGRPGQELLCRDQVTRNLWGEAWRSVVETGTWRGEMRQEGRHGQSFVAASRWMLLCDPNRGEARSILIANTDITASRQIEENLLEAVGKLAEQLDQPRLVGVSPAIKEIAEMVRQAASSPFTHVLLTGERGVGKERVARAIHSATRSRGRFVGINCAALTETLFESLLFGHERGAFTGANRRARGYVEQAAGGTLLLDEIDALGPSQQAKLNRVLEEREFQPLGSEESHPLQARVVATSNGDLQAAARAGTFRADLYDRLAVLAIEVPPLREHREDVAPLAEYFVATLSAKLKLRTRGLSEEAREKLRRYQGDWPGNVRGLRNVIERALIRAQGGWITAEGIILDDAVVTRPAADLSQAQDAIGTSPVDPNRLIRDLVGRVSPAEVSRRMVQQALAGAGDNQTVAAKMLGISRFKLRRLLKAHRNTDRQRSEGKQHNS